MTYYQLAPANKKVQAKRIMKLAGLFAKWQCPYARYDIYHNSVLWIQFIGPARTVSLKFK